MFLGRLAFALLQIDCVGGEDHVGHESCKVDGDGDPLVLHDGDAGVDHLLLDSFGCDRPSLIELLTFGK